MTTINDYLNNQRINKSLYDDLVRVTREIGFNKKVIDWFMSLYEWEIEGWRTKTITKQIAKLLVSSKPVQFFALFCPSYKKGFGLHGFRTDDVGETTLRGIEKLQEITDLTTDLGFTCLPPEATFFDLALEQPEKTKHELDDLASNINNLEKHIPKTMRFSVLSVKFPVLADLIGYAGIKLSPLPVDERVTKRIVDRGEKFYQRFGWDAKQIVDRSETVISSEFIVGRILKHYYPDAIMVYTPTMLERAQLYKDIPIIFPKQRARSDI